MDLKRAFEILEIDETASFSEVKQAYRDLASIWHPDRYSQNSRLAEKSLQKMKELNAAYDLLSAFYTEKNLAKSQARRHYDEEEITIVKCKKCGALNRIQNLAGVTFKCGKCQYNLFSEKTYDDNSERILCADESCIGIIRNGRCSVCGKTIEEGKKEDERKTRLHQQQYSERQKVEIRNQKRKKIIKYSAIAAFVILFIYGIYQDDSNTDKRYAPKVSQSVGPENIFPKKDLNDNTYQISEIDFRENANEKDNLIDLQRDLKFLGYEIGSIDGIIGAKTIKECNKFIADFWIFSKVNSIESLMNYLKIHAAVSAVYPEWANIVQNNLLESWVTHQPVEFKKRILSALKSNNPKNIIVVLNFYSFDKEKPPHQPIPKDGVFWKSFGDGVAPLKISTRDKQQNHFIKILDSGTNKEILKAFLRGGNTIEFGIPLGTYIIKYAAGERWYGERFLFGPYTAYGKADKVFEFRQIGYQISGYSVELYLQPYGNLHTSTLSAFQF